MLHWPCKTCDFQYIFNCLGCLPWILPYNCHILYITECYSECLAVFFFPFQVINNQIAYSNMLKYDIPKFQGPIRRAVPFSVPVACYFNRYNALCYGSRIIIKINLLLTLFFHLLFRYLYTYKIGFTPKMQIKKIFKPMKNSARFILTPRNGKT